MPELVLKLGDTVVQTYVFDKDIMSIGRSRDNDIVVENLSVSRNHARIRHQHGKYVLTDLNSANGTYVNGVRVTKTELFHEDVISVGKHKLAFMNKEVSAEDPFLADLGGGGERTMLVEHQHQRQPALVVTEGKLKGREFALTKFETSVGKAPGNDIVISDDWFLGKKQAVIYKRGNDFELHDLGGIRKTKINGEQVAGPRILKSGDVLELGSIKCMFRAADDVGAGGRVPQEMPQDDSIYAAGGAYSSQMADDNRRAIASNSTLLPEDEEEEVVVEAVESESSAAHPILHEANGSSPALNAFNSMETVQEESSSVAFSGNAPAQKKSRGTGSSAVIAKPAASATPIDQAGTIAISRREHPIEPLPDQNDPAVQKEIAIWEAALDNRSPVIRKQALKMLKKLTGRDYEL